MAVSTINLREIYSKHGRIFLCLFFLQFLLEEDQRTPYTLSIDKISEMQTQEKNIDRLTDRRIDGYTDKRKIR